MSCVLISMPWWLTTMSTTCARLVLYTCEGSAGNLKVAYSYACMIHPESKQRIGYGDQNLHLLPFCRISYGNLPAAGSQ